MTSLWVCRELPLGVIPCIKRQCGQVGHWAEVCQTLDARLRDRLAAVSRWSPLGAPSGSRDTKRMGWRVAVSIPNEDSRSSGDESTPLEKGEPRAGREYGPATSSESAEENEKPPVLGPPRGARWTQTGARM